MKILSFNTLYADINKKLTSTRWLTRMGLKEDIIYNCTNNEKYLETLKYMVDNMDFSAKTTVVLCENMMTDCISLENKNFILEKIYKFTLKKSFPNAVNEDFSEGFSLFCGIFLRIFKVINEYEKYCKNNSFQSLYPLIFLSSQEKKALERPEEYNTFLKAFKKDYLYEMMKLNKEVVGFNTLDHICGVHYLSLHIARQLKDLDIPIDLGRVSGAAAGHDIGKYGCRQQELKKVPRLHYYYTDIWFKKHGIDYIRNIAINHSTWDLELENLSLESLILIYCDFRVKNIIENNSLKMSILSLKDSFNVILNKLENLDEAKEKRYKKVYGKLKDFEAYLIYLGVNINLDHQNSPYIEKRLHNYSLLQGNDICKKLKFLSIEHNINLMYKLRDEYSLDNILDMARSEKDWKKLRQYIRILEEYSTYLTGNQKIQTIKFLYENLIHVEDDIRKHCAQLIGSLISNLDEEYRKDLPEDVKLNYTWSIGILQECMDSLLYPGYKFIPKHKNWIMESSIAMVNSLFTHSKENMLLRYREVIISFYKNFNNKNLNLQIILLEMSKYIPITPYDEDVEILFNFILNSLNNNDITCRLCSLEACYNLLVKMPFQNNLKNNLKNKLENSKDLFKTASETLLVFKLKKLFNLNSWGNSYKKNPHYTSEHIQNIFLSNLKTATSWINKKIQIDILLAEALEHIRTEGLHTCLHFCNLLKVSDSEIVRNKAGESILKLLPYLSISEKNEVCVELLRALEIEGHRFTEYIPKYLGIAILYLKPKELDEVIDDLSLKIKSAKPNIKTLLIKTVSTSISNYPLYKDVSNEKEGIFTARLIKMLCIILNGVGDYEPLVKQASLTSYGSDIFYSKILSLQEKVFIFKSTSKKLLTLMDFNNQNDLSFFTNSIVLNNLYRFISECIFQNGSLELPIKNNIAFFPGTFDPFSLSHKEIAKHIRDMGFEVYLNVDEFSWSKRTLPNLLRKKIIEMSISDELDIYVYPDNFQINIANKENLKTLKESFKNSKVHIAIGSDVLLNASSYKKKSILCKIPHIIFLRGNTKKLENYAKDILDEFTILKLPKQFSNISSTQIRSCIDESRDISTLVDPLTEQYIYKYGFYQKEPDDKNFMEYYSIDVEIVENLSAHILDEFKNFINLSPEEIDKYFHHLFQKPSSRILILRDRKTKNILGFSSFYWLRSSMLYGDLKDMELSEYLREHSLGRIILIDNIYVENRDKISYLEQILITETLAFCISKDYQYAVYRCVTTKTFSQNIYDILKLQGFIEISSSNKASTLVVNMNNPYIINLDMENLLKEPFRNNLKIKNILISSRKTLQKALTKLYPGELVLSFHCHMTYSSMVKKICNENKVSLEQLKVKKLGDSMCVPYGDLLDRYIIPNTITKSLHTEKYFYPNMKNFFIGEFPYYLTLQNQVKTIKSFNRPVILVDNLLHKGHRIKALYPFFKNENINIQKIIVGIMSGKGKDLMDIQGYKVDSVYFIPRLKIWFNETALYPFIGGDAIWRGVKPTRNLIPSVNSIMPYTHPSFIENSSFEAIYNLSRTCLENSIYIFSILEEEFHRLEKRNLTLWSLGEVFTIPRCPELGNDIVYDLNLSPSHYLKNQLDTLERFSTMIKK
ncbi:cytidyltransferase [Haloimpatiens massiliensis]|uniref:cytidyltransferase n=1 Tax=Haloimpatiens massiliensis TaxID=1658110 RepID=UPI000C82DE2D|nr:cytidyltransferase [Haloimpatiens massiliensis]